MGEKTKLIDDHIVPKNVYDSLMLNNDAPHIALLGTEIVYSSGNYNFKLNGTDMGDFKGNSISVDIDTAKDEILINEKPRDIIISKPSNADLDSSPNELFNTKPFMSTEVLYSNGRFVVNISGENAKTVDGNTLDVKLD